MEMFEKATRMKLRYETTAAMKCSGLLNTEDLWDLSLENLNELAKALSREVKGTEESFIEPVKQGASVSNLKFEIVKHIIAIKLEKLAKAKSAASDKMEREKLLQVIEARESEALKEVPLEDLKKRAAELA